MALVIVERLYFMIQTFIKYVRGVLCVTIVINPRLPFYENHL